MIERLKKWMRSREMREQFPDPAQRKAALYAGSRHAADNFYELASKAVHTCCAKQDVPQVQTVIALLQGPLEAFWRSQMTGALDAAVDRLRELEDDLPTSQVDGLALSETKRRDEELILLAFLAVLERAAAQFPVRIERLLGKAAEDLLRAGARSQSLDLDLARIPAIRAAARDDLRTLVSGRIESRTQDLREHAQEFLRSKRARTPARVGDITQAAEGFRSRNLQEWLARAVKLVGLNTASWLPAVVDQWSYRWFVIGQFVSGRQAGFSELVAVAVIDGKTTPFCIWVNGRVLSVSALQSQLDRHLRLSIAGDIESLIGNWPMLSSKITQSESRSVLRRGFARVGMPPYHFRCRTLLRWIRPGQ